MLEHLTVDSRRRIDVRMCVKSFYAMITAKTIQLCHGYKSTLITPSASSDLATKATKPMQAQPQHS